MTAPARFARTLLEPRTLLIAMSGLGALFLAYVLLAASEPTQKPWEAANASLLTGDMEAFAPTFPPRGVPEVMLEGPDGEPVFLSELIGRGPAVVNLWATWCPPCIEELPSLAALKERLSGEVPVYTIAMEAGDPQRQRDMLARLGLEEALPLYRDPSLSLLRSFTERRGSGAAAGLPITVIYDSRAQEVGRLAGAADWTSPEALRLVRSAAAGEAEF